MATVRGDPPLVARRRLGFVGQEEGAWNRADPGREDCFRECAYCRDPWHHVDLVTLSLLDDPFEGAEPMVLIGGSWLHTDCAEDMAQAITPNPGAYPYVNEERRAR